MLNGQPPNAIAEGTPLAMTWQDTDLAMQATYLGFHWLQVRVKDSMKVYLRRCSNCLIIIATDVRS